MVSVFRTITTLHGELFCWMLGIFELYHTSSTSCNVVIMNCYLDRQNKLLTFCSLPTLVVAIAWVEWPVASVWVCLSVHTLKGKCLELSTAPHFRHKVHGSCLAFTDAEVKRCKVQLSSYVLRTWGYMLIRLLGFLVIVVSSMVHCWQAGQLGVRAESVDCDTDCSTALPSIVRLWIIDQMWERCCEEAQDWC